jgi:transcriptional regulator with XRE-family HTH domain
MKSHIEKIRKIRLAKKISQDEIAEKAGLSRVAYTYLENGKTNPEAIKLVSAIGIAQALNIPFNDLFEIENSKEMELTNEIVRLKRELENCKKELEKIKLERDVYQDMKGRELKGVFMLEQALQTSQKNFNESSAKLLLSESFQFLDNDLFAAKFPDLMGKKSLIKVFDFETAENFFYLFKSNIDEILNYIDLNKFRNDIRLAKLLSKFNLSNNNSDLFNEIERFQASLRKELNL